MNFLEIYDLYYHQVRAFVSKMIRDEWAAADLAQEVFIKVRGNLNRLRTESKLKAWIFQIARNLCFDYLRSRKSHNERQGASDDLKAYIDQDTLKRLEQNQMSQCVQEKIHLLPDKMSTVLILSETMGLSNREIADTLKISIGNVKVRLHRARKALREILEHDCVFEHDERNVMVCLPSPTEKGSKDGPVMEAK